MPHAMKSIEARLIVRELQEAHFCADPSADAWMPWWTQIKRDAGKRARLDALRLTVLALAPEMRA
jgi:hypothetical protein